MDKIKAQVFNALRDLAKAYGKEAISQERLEIYTEFLVSELTVAELRKSFAKILTTCKFFPSIAEIVELAKPAIDSNEEATVIASEIIECISRFGYYQGKDAKEFLGEKFEVVDRFGGWSSLCQIDNDAIQSTRAQLRELAKAYINRTKREIKSDFRINAESRNVIENQLRSGKVTGSFLMPLSHTLPTTNIEGEGC